MDSVGLINQHILRHESPTILSENVNKTHAPEKHLVDTVKLNVQEGLSFDANHTTTSLKVEKIATIVEFYLSIGEIQERLRTILDALSVPVSKIKIL
ncbi:hypothetical protein JCM33374_g3505 [Metschnikowia sp. JCM 33374]|nr:hypothetical protein JCM33374_g3505 [Metschnikowia sp. JCM 33374]